MLGAAAMDLADVKGRTMLNLDSEDEGIFTVSCAGGATCTVSLNAERKAVYGPCVRLSVEGLRGGHSGAEIHKNRANANKVMGDFLGRIQKLMPLCLTSFSGGSKDNAIPGPARRRWLPWASAWSASTILPPSCSRRSGKPTTNPRPWCRPLTWTLWAETP